MVLPSQECIFSPKLFCCNNEHGISYNPSASTNALPLSAPAVNSTGSYLIKRSLTPPQYYPIYGNCCFSIKSVVRILPLRKTFPSSNCPREELKRKVYTSQQDILQCVTAISVCRPLSPFPPFHLSLFIIFSFAMELRGISTLSAVEKEEMLAKSSISVWKGELSYLGLCPWQAVLQHLCVIILQTLSFYPQENLPAALQNC